MLKAKLNVKIFPVNNFICWGTPSDLKQYYFWEDYFKSKIHNTSMVKEYNNQVNLIPMAGLGSRFKDYGYRISKPMIQVKNKPMVVTACQSFP